MKKVAIIIAFKNFRDEEYFTLQQLLEEGGAEIKVVSDELGMASGVDGGEVEVEIKLSDLNVSDFDAVVFIGGSGALGHLDNEDSYRVAKDVVAQGKVLAAICISPTILAKANVLQDKKATVWTSPLDKNPKKVLEGGGAEYQDKDVVVDNRIITANGPGAAKEFGEAILSTS
jgi:protease I